MKVVTVGSRIFDDALVNSHEKINNEKRIVGISPFSIYGKYDLPDMAQENIPYEERMFLYQYSHNMKIDLAGVEYDYLIIDFLSVAEELLECSKVDTEVFYALRYPWLEQNLDTICKKYKIEVKKRISPVNWPVQTIKKELVMFCDYLLAIVPKEKIIMLKTFIPYQYVDNDVIKTDDVMGIIRKNEIIGLCQDIFIDKIAPHVIEMPYNFVRLDKEKDSYNIKFSHKNYEYIIKSFFQIASIKGGHLDTYQNDSEDDAVRLQQNFLDSFALMPMKDIIRKNFKNRRLVLLCESSAVSDDDEDWKNAEFIPYIKAMKESDLEELLKKYRGLNQDYFFVLPHIYNKTKILKVLYKHGYMIRRDIAVYQMEPIILKEFEGKYIDCFNNMIDSKHKASIQLSGIGCKVIIESTAVPQRINISDLRDESRIYVGENVMADRLELKTLWAGEITIGEQSTFAERCYLVAAGYANLFIGMDTMFSTEVVCHCGDGHAIYDHQLGIITNNQYDDYGTGNIRIEDHVWIGYQAMLLKGAHVGSGSILGARTVLAKAVPNNCIVAGIPGRIVHRDIYWEREPFTDTIENPVYAYATEVEESLEI